MKPFTHILCPVDFSDFSHRAVKLALGLAGDFQAELTVYHVVDSMPVSLGTLVPVPEAFDIPQAVARKKMASLARSLKLSKTEMEVASQITHRMIAKKASEAGADLVVMGTHGASGFEKLFLGSTTEKVLHQIDVPLLAVPARKRSSVSASDEAGAKRFGTIVMAVDFGSSTAAITEYALALTRQYGSKLVAVHAVDLLLHCCRGPAAHREEQDLLNMLNETMAERRILLEKLIPDAVRGHYETQVQVFRGNPFEVICRIAEERVADLIVMGAHGYGKTTLGWLGSTVHKVLRAAPCPVLAVQEAN